MGMALLAVMSGCKSGNEEVAQVVEEKTPIVSVVSAEFQQVPQDADYSTTIQAYAINHIVPQQGARIKKLNVEIGDFVSAGQILAEMDRTNLVASELKLKNDGIELERVRQLLAEGGVSQSDFDQMEMAYNVSKTNIDNLIENTVLRSPINGVISARNYDKGDMYSMSSPLYTVEQVTPVKMIVALSESDYTRVHKGDKVTLVADAFPGKTFEGSVARLYPTIDNASHTFGVEVQVRNADRLLRPGMYARATVNMGVNHSIVVPDQAIQKLQGAGQRYVFVMNDDSTVSIKNVTTGRHFESQYEILSGLEEGDKVVYQGQSALKAGDKVEVAR